MAVDHGLKAKDWTNVEVLVALHGESRSGLAWRVSINGDPEIAVWLPKSLTECGEACGGFERMDARCQREIVPIHSIELPRWLAEERGLLWMETT